MASLAARVLACVLSCMGVSLAWASTPPGLPTGQLVDLEVEHVVAVGEHLTLLGARYGIGARLLATRNGLSADARLRPGQRLTVRSQHLLADDWHVGHDEGPFGAIVINLPQRMLFLMRDGMPVLAHPVAAGRPDWRTPTGEFHVISRETDKTWFVPPSIQAEMRREGKPVLTQVPPGPDNPLGRHWIGLSLPGIGIHGTIAPSSIYGLRSHGCIRMQPDHVEALFDRVRLSTPGRILYRAVMLMHLHDGSIWFEAHPDAYRRERITLEDLRARARLDGVDARIDWTLVARMLRERDGQARPVATSALAPQPAMEGGTR